MLRVSTAARPLSHASTNGGWGRPAALAVMLGPGRGSAKSVNELEDTVSYSPRRALRQVALRTSPEVAPNYGHPAALLARSRWVRRVRRVRAGAVGGPNGKGAQCGEGRRRADVLATFDI